MKASDADDYVEMPRESVGNNEFRIGGVLSQFFGLWVGRLGNILLDENSMFDIPKDFKLVEMTSGFKTAYEKLKKLELAVHMFTLENSLAIYILVVLSKLFEIATLFCIFLIVKTYNQGENNMPNLGFQFIAGAMVAAFLTEFLRFSCKHYAGYKAKKLGMTLVASLGNVVLNQLMNKDLDVNYDLDEAGFQKILDTHIGSFMKYPEYHMFEVDFWTHLVLTAAIGIFIFRFNFLGGFLLLIIGFIGTSSLFTTSSQKRTKVFEKLSNYRAQLVTNIIKNKFYIKARAWETVFFNRVWKAREAELSARSKMESVNIIEGWMLWIIAYASMVLIMVTWVKSGATPIFYYFIVFARLYLDYYALFRQKLQHRRENDDRRNCILAIEAFISGRDVKTVTVKEDPQVKNYYSVFLQAAYFSWNDVASIKLKRIDEPKGNFGRYVKDNPNDMIFEEDEEDEEEEEQHQNFDEEEGVNQTKDPLRSRNQTMQRNSFLENSVAYTMKSESNARKPRYEPGQVAGHDLTNITIKIRKSQICFIHGEAGSGKTSLVKAIMGEMLLDDRFKAKVTKQSHARCLCVEGSTTCPPSPG